MVEQAQLIPPLQPRTEASLCQSWAKAALVDQAPGELCSSPQAHQPEREQLRGELQPPWQERSQGTFVEKQCLGFPQHHCQDLRDQLFCYEEEPMAQELEQHKQEQLAQARHTVSLLEVLLGLYKRKFQASLGRAGELESRQQQLAEELASQAQAREEAARKMRAQQLSLQEQLKGRSRQLARAEETIARLVQELRGAQGQRGRAALLDLQEQLAASHAKLEEREQEASHLRLRQHREAQLEEALAASQEQTQQLRSQCQALQRERENCSAEEERLGELGREVQHWRQKHQAAEQALAAREEELVVLKVEVATLEEKWGAAAKEVETLKGERAVTQHLLQESERMEASVSQWVKEQKQVNEKLGHKIQDQIKQLAQLTGERDHLQGVTERLQQENKWLRSQVEELRVEQECFQARAPAWVEAGSSHPPWPSLVLQALHSRPGDSRARQRQPWPGKDRPPQQSPRC